MNVVKGNKVSLMDEAKAEVEKDILEKAKGDLKKKIKQLYDAKVIVSNLEREIQFLEDRLNQELNDIQ
jgi:uncharacterized protein involved in exopolysaccharide biosynthesis